VTASMTGYGGRYLSSNCWYTAG